MGIEAFTRLISQMVTQLIVIISESHHFRNQLGIYYFLHNTCFFCCNLILMIMFLEMVFFFLRETQESLSCQHRWYSLDIYKKTEFSIRTFCRLVMFSSFISSTFIIFNVGTSSHPSSSSIGTSPCRHPFPTKSSIAKEAIFFSNREKTRATKNPVMQSMNVHF